MAGADVLGCLGAIISAFHGAAGLVQIIKQRNDRRRRMNGVSQNAEEAFEEKMLLKSLNDGETQCKNARDKKYKRHGPAFKEGDSAALSALKDVMVNMQMDIISALQVAQAVTNAKLDVSRLHESAIMNKNAALRAIDELCKRLPEAEFEGSSAANVESVRTNDSNNGEVRMTGVDRPLAVSLPYEPPSPPRRPALSSTSRSSQSQPQSPPPQTKSAPAKKRGGFARMFSGFSASLTMANDDYGAFHREANTLREQTLKDAERQRKSPDPDEMARLSNCDSGFGGSDTSSRHRTATSVTSTLFSEGHQSSLTLDSSRPQEGTPRRESATLPSISVSPDPEHPNNNSGFIHSHSNSIASSSARPANAMPMTLFDEDDGVMRATLAPEVVTPEYESMLPHRPSSRPGTAPPSESPHLRNVHPAFRDVWPMDSRMSPPEQSGEWAPHRPAKLDTYHNFCPGARKIRDRIEEGLSVAMLPGKNGATIPYWKCKECNFRSKAGSSSGVLPDHIYIIPGEIRYRWLFLAKSHMHAETSHSKLETYSYGCVFCAAEGRETAVHPTLDALMSHIASRHRNTAMMTPEVREKTKCIVGGLPEDVDDWDIDLPESKEKRKLGGVFTRR